jgi:hypothetical protein
MLYLLDLTTRAGLPALFYNNCTGQTVQSGYRNQNYSKSLCQIWIVTVCFDFQKIMLQIVAKEGGNLAFRRFSGVSARAGHGSGAA